MNIIRKVVSSNFFSLFSKINFDLMDFDKGGQAVNLLSYLTEKGSKALHFSISPAIATRQAEIIETRPLTSLLV